MTKSTLKICEDYSGLLSSTGQSRPKKTREDYYSGLLFSAAVRLVWRIAQKHLMTMTADQTSVD